MIKNLSRFVGYYKLRAKTDETILDNGWLRTGDVAELVPETGAFKIIDRVSSIIKLSQGEFVSPEKMECVYSTSLFV